MSFTTRLLQFDAAVTCHHRATRGGRIFNPYMLDDAIVLPSVNISELLMRRHAQRAGQSRSDASEASDTDSEFDGDENQDGLAPGFLFTFGSPSPAAASSSAASSSSTLNCATTSRKRAYTSSIDASPSKRARIDHADSNPPLKDKKQRKIEAKRERRRIQREDQRTETMTQEKAVTRLRVKQSKPLDISLHFAEHTRPLASSYWMGLRDTVIADAAARDAAPGDPPFELPEHRAYDLGEMRDPARRMHIIDWHGVPTPLVDSQREVIGVLGGGPRDPGWQADVADAAAHAMEQVAQELYGDTFYAEVYYTRKHGKKKTTAAHSIPASQEIPRRGPHHSESVGISMGGGQEQPTCFFHTALHLLLLGQLLATEPFRRISGFINAIFRSYAPKLHEHYRSTMEALHQHLPHLPRNYDEFTSVFAAATFNFGPFTVTFPHLDFANLAWGWCAITALGRFDPDKGGHLILWDLHLVIRFPPGCSILIPSAILRHSNVSIQQGETRYSFTQYTAAGIFRYVYNGFRTDKSMKTGLSKAEKARRARDREARWAEGVKMYSKWDVAVE
ncbi:hypothetical protein C8R47DRAFT_1063654 [Mycena vitilis]|nr:hypothetical protein C8R47DRAFT_1063654 [Mycena vitilis]